MQSLRLPSSRGFTLIELMVTLVVIALLSTLALAGFQTVQRRSRDAQRVIAMQQITKAIDEAYSTTRGAQPLVTTTPYVFATDATPTTLRTLLTPYLPNATLPKDPLNRGNYVIGMHVNPWQIGVTASGTTTRDNLALRSGRIAVVVGQLEGTLPEENAADVLPITGFSKSSMVNDDLQPSCSNGIGCGDIALQMYLLATSCGSPCILRP
jgi:prepilin-type N-terminal cleavage/methylation domain-containing protein